MNSFVQSFNYLGRNNPPEVEFNLHAETHRMSLTDFCNICLIPSDGDLREPRPSEFEDFLLAFTVGEDRGVSRATATSLQFPSVHYFALVITKCLTGTEKVGALSAPDLAILRHALYDDHTFSMGAIIARRFHLSKTKGKIHGGIYATRLARHFRV